MRGSTVIVGATIALTALVTGSPVRGQAANPRYGVWKLKSDAPPPSSNVMTYEAYNGTGMKITVDSVNASGAKSSWWYTTMFDGKDEPITGNRGADTGSVKVLNDRVNEIVYKKAGQITQVLTNILSPDGDTLAVVYMRVSPTGPNRASFATYERQK